ncbi:MAG: FecR domain-containing protein [Bacteroidota bacterium]
MKYFNYTVTDFIMDEHFQQWIKSPDAESNVFWENWLTQHPEKKEQVEQARLLLLSLDFEKTLVAQINQAKMWEKIKVGMQEQVPEPGAAILPSTAGTSFFSQWRKLAAVLVGLAVMSALAYFFLSLSNTVRYTTAYGDREVVQLPDGSVVTLNGHSTLKYNTQSWEISNVREVWLEGEAFFSIVKKPVADKRQQQPSSSRFIVHVRDLNIEVLGTEFDVRNRRGNTSVVLNSGKVSLRRNRMDGEADVVMQPTDRVDYSETSKALVKQRVNPEHYSSWVNKKLIFNETPLSDIAQVLEDNYGLEVQFEDAALASRKFTGSVSTDNIDLLLTAIGVSFNVSIVQEGKQISIQNKQ